MYLACFVLQMMSSQEKQEATQILFNGETVGQLDYF